MYSLLVYLSVRPPMYRRTTNLFALVGVHFCTCLFYSLIHSQYTYLDCRFLSTFYTLEKWKISFCLRRTNGIFSQQLDLELSQTRTQVPEDPLSSRMADLLKKVGGNPMNIREVYR